MSREGHIMKMSPLPYSPAFLSIESFVNLYILLHSHVLKKSNFPPSKAFESHFNCLITGSILHWFWFCFLLEEGGYE